VSTVWRMLPDGHSNIKLIIICLTYSLFFSYKLHRELTFIDFKLTTVRYFKLTTVRYFKLTTVRYFKLITVRCFKLTTVRYFKLTTVRYFKLTTVRYFKLTAVRYFKLTTVRYFKLITVRCFKLTTVRYFKLTTVRYFKLTTVRYFNPGFFHTPISLATRSPTCSTRSVRLDPSRYEVFIISYVIYSKDGRSVCSPATITAVFVIHRSCP